MDAKTESEDAWVLARLAALERGNRNLWVGVGALAAALVSVCLVALLLFRFGPPGGLGAATGGDLHARDLELRGALRIVDDSGRNLVWIGREPATSSAPDAIGQTVIGLFSTEGPLRSEQTVRIATSPLGSALSLGTLDGKSSTSLFAGDSGPSLELRRGELANVLGEVGGATAARPAAPAARAPRGAESASGRAESTAVASRPGGEPERGAPVDLSDAALQPLGHGFFVGRLALSDQEGGLRVRGRIVNATSVDQLRAEFRLLVAGRESSFSVGRIDAGGSAAFTLELPRTPAAELGKARMRWVRSTVSYPAD